MEPRVVAVAVTLLLVGGFLLVIPAAGGAVTDLSVRSGTWIDAAIPWSASISAVPVDVQVVWGFPPPACLGTGVSCPAQIVPAYLLVFDCGSSACEGNANYSFVGSSDTTDYGSMGFSGAPGHHYQIWVWTVLNSTRNASIPLQYSLVTPVLGGGLGAGLIALGVVVAVYAVRRHPAPGQNSAREGTLPPR